MSVTDHPAVPITGMFHALTAGAALSRVRSRIEGLSAEEHRDRLAEIGPNRLDETPPVPAWRRFGDQFTNRLTLILLAAAAVSLAASQDLKTPVVVLVVVLMNAIIGHVQESRAETSLAALRRMLATTARVRRGGSLQNVETASLVPGDIVMVEAGDRIPADSRVIGATNLEVEEAALTGESEPVVKSIEPVSADAALGDRRSMAYMNTTVTRGRGELVVTATGMSTEIGRIAGLLQATETENSPLQRQLDRLARSLARLAGVIVTIVVVVGLIGGESIGDLLLTAVALAVASIPEGLPAVTAVTLALGVSRMAHQNAIVKRLASVETLGCTNVICSDKTGTLTMNKMTARTVVHPGGTYEISGEGYSPDGTIGDESTRHLFGELLRSAALCNDAVVRNDDTTGWHAVGDPTEGALVALAMKGGIDIDEVRRQSPRLAEIPFDSAHKFMATFHRVESDCGARIIRMYVKGAPDVLLQRSTTMIDEHGVIVPLSVGDDDLATHNDRLGSTGLRVLALATRDIDDASWDGGLDQQAADLVSDLTMLGLVGIIDPPRAEAHAAIATAKSAGIDVKMITGDHATTAATIARDLGLEGAAITGAELDTMSDEELTRRLADISVFARVSPEHKLRLVSLMKERGDTVAMTGDGVNDAPALKRADIGVAMGIAGTEVTKEAATMVLTDDNFATIVSAVERGRTIYDNIVKFVRFQLSTTLGFATIFLLASLFDIAGRIPFAAIAILWVNIIMDGPPAMALGVDRPTTGIMARRPRPPDEPILTRARWIAVGLAAAVMAAGTLSVFVLAPGGPAVPGVATVAGTMALNTFVLFQFFNILNVRSDHHSVFRRDTLTNRWLWAALTGVITLQVAVTHVGPAQRLFDTTDIGLANWLACIAVASSVLWFEEIRKAIVRIVDIRSTHQDPRRNQ